MKICYVLWGLTFLISSCRSKGDMQFVDVSTVSGTADSTGFQTGVTTVDINSDGWMDLYLSVSGIHNQKQARKNRLYVNQGADRNGIPVFVEDAQSYHLDIAINNSGVPSIIYENQARGL